MESRDSILAKGGRTTIVQRRPTTAGPSTMGCLIYCLAAVLCVDTISGCSALRPERPGIFL
jgi:hypothetical protein